MNESVQATVGEILLRLVVAAVIGGFIGFERRTHHKAVGVAGMMLVGIGSATYMLLAKHLSELDPASVSRALQGLLSGIGFLGGAVIFKSGGDVHGIKAAASVWITGAIGLAVGTSYWWLGVTVGVVTVAVLFFSDSFPDAVREERREAGVEAAAGKKL
ncbi:MAG TPA: MgtC/SapB family protein [Pyrinomonadaceae bacterium]|jgi:putative Mg2+ transporter-C (MgtC) family protein|nr:MgtC/SapB family protein [Pyrinomonadaceae bacterium]